MQTTIAERNATATMTLQAIAPNHIASFSPNLYAWMKVHGHFYREGGVLHGVWCVRAQTPASKYLGESTLLLGYATAEHAQDSDFVGVRLIAALARGAKAEGMFYPGLASDIEPIPDFWEKYLEVGRCAIDPAHSEHFVGSDRFVADGDIRTCLWCGAKQRRVLVPRVVHDESWIDE